jgi:hypothetical protein
MGPSDGGGASMTGDGGAASGHAPIPSPGCALASATPTLPDTISLPTQLALPPGYDGVTPRPLLIHLHATGGGGEISLFKADPLIGPAYVLAGPQARTGGVYSFESVPKITNVLTSILDELLASVCVDESRVFATGNGSGGRVLTSWVAARDKAQNSLRFRALAAVGAYYGKYAWQPTPLLFIHGLQSRYSANVAGDEFGTKAFAILSGMNACGEASTPVSADQCPAQAADDPGCVDLEGCAAPFRFCHFEGKAEDDVWPCFATKAIAQFFEPFRQ